MGRLKCNDIKWQKTITSDYSKRLKLCSLFKAKFIFKELAPGINVSQEKISMKKMLINFFISINYEHITLLVLEKQLLFTSISF